MTRRCRESEEVIRGTNFRMYLWLVVLMGSFHPSCFLLTAKVFRVSSTAHESNRETCELLVWGFLEK